MLRSSVANLIAAAQKRVIIVSAFVSGSTLEHLLKHVPLGIEARIYTRWRIDDLVRGASDPDAWNIARRYNATLYSHPRLHAKIYIADDQALVGSSNATLLGLGGGSYPNLEILIETSAQHPAIISILGELRDHASTAKYMSPNDINKWQKVYSQSSQHVVGETIETMWWPSSEPLLLLRACQGEAEQSEVTLADCQALGLTVGADKRAIKNAVSSQPIFINTERCLITNKAPLTRSNLMRSLVAETDITANRVRDKIDVLLKWLDTFSDDMYVMPTDSEELGILCHGKRLGSL